MIDRPNDAHRASEAHLDALMDALNIEEEGGTPDWPESLGPFCGCQTCCIREALAAAWPHMLALAADLVLEHGYAAAARVLKAVAEQNTLPGHEVPA